MVKAGGPRGEYEGNMIWIFAVKGGGRGGYATSNNMAATRVSYLQFKFKTKIHNENLFLRNFRSLAFNFCAKYSCRSFSLQVFTINFHFEPRFQMFGFRTFFFLNL